MPSTIGSYREQRSFDLSMNFSTTLDREDSRSDTPLVRYVRHHSSRNSAGPTNANISLTLRLRPHPLSCPHLTATASFPLMAPHFTATATSPVTSPLYGYGQSPSHLHHRPSFPLARSAMRSTCTRCWLRTFCEIRRAKISCKSTCQNIPSE